MVDGQWQQHLTPNKTRLAAVTRALKETSQGLEKGGNLAASCCTVRCAISLGATRKRYPHSFSYFPQCARLCDAGDYRPSDPRVLQKSTGVVRMLIILNKVFLGGREKENRLKLVLPCDRGRANRRTVLRFLLNLLLYFL